MQAAESQAACCSVSSLKISTIVLGAIGLVLWPNAIGFTVGYGFYGAYVPGTMVAAIIIIITNAAYIYLTSLIIFRLTKSRIPSHEDVDALRQNTARLVAFLLVGFAEWVTSVVWFAMYGMDWDGWHVYKTLFGCSFSFVWTAVVAGVSGSLTQQYGFMRQVFPQDTIPMADGFDRRPPQYSTSSRSLGRVPEPIYAQPHRSRGPAPVHGRTSPWADSIQLRE